MTRALFLSLLLASAASAQVVVGENVSFYAESLPEVAVNVSKCADPTTHPNCLGAVASLRYANGSIWGWSRSLDEGLDVYRVHEGDAFSRAAIDSGRFQSLFEFFENPIPVGTDFYLGLNTGWGFAESHRSVYGWVRLREENGKLAMVSNAVAYSGSGIIVGTAAMLPEPSTLTALVALTLVACSSRRAVAAIRS